MKVVLVTGGRGFGRLYPTRPWSFPRQHAERAVVADALVALWAEIGPFRIVQGGASGADEVARTWAKNNSVDCYTYKAEWGDISSADAVVKTRKSDGLPYDALAGLRRNQKMLDDSKPDIVVAFPGAKGTADMISRAEKAGVPVRRIEGPK